MGRKLQCKTENFVPVVPRLSSSSIASSSYTSVTAGFIKFFFEPSPDQKKKDNKGTTGNRLRDFPEWLQEFTDNLEDTEVPASAYISHDSDSERLTKVASRKHGIHTHFPQDRNCEICQRTKITRAPCRRRTGEAVPRAEKFGDLITAAHKVLNEGGESRHNHQYAVVVQDSATEWSQSYPCKTKTSQETERSLRKFLEPSEKPKVIYIDNSPEFGKSCED